MLSPAATDSPDKREIHAAVDARCGKVAKSQINYEIFIDGGWNGGLSAGEDAGRRMARRVCARWRERGGMR
jgi:hypothetical protein